MKNIPANIRKEPSLQLLSQIADFYIDSMYEATIDEIARNFKLDASKVQIIFLTNKAFQDILSDKKRSVKEKSTDRFNLLESKTYSEMNNEIKMSEDSRLKALYLIEIMKNASKRKEIETRQEIESNKTKIDSTTPDELAFKTVPDELKGI